MLKGQHGCLARAGDLFGSSSGREDGSTTAIVLCKSGSCLGSRLLCCLADTHPLSNLVLDPVIVIILIPCLHLSRRLFQDADSSNASFSKTFSGLPFLTPGAGDNCMPFFFQHP